MCVLAFTALYQVQQKGFKFTTMINAVSSSTKSSENQARRAIREDFDKCSVSTFQSHSEFWGEVVKPGISSGQNKGLQTASAGDCCKECQATRGCNVWVWCSDAGSCGTQCWLKRVGTASEVKTHNQGDHVPWISGSVAKDFDRDIASLPTVNTSISCVLLTTPQGVIRIKLRPDWSNSSVEYVRRVAMTKELCTLQCEFYRAEPGFLLQGSLRAYIPPNAVTTPGPKFMERGEIGWAGGSAGPDWFIFLGSQAATHWNHDHTVWGEIADAESLAVAEKIVILPAVAAKPGEMHMMVERVPFTISAG
ncbi:hypothetical protein CEUSTIGMA_g186.t1 [Chlamydomonas eustigma]|uniref:Apple domain-containing protein n=1 Tax=Chlamydomonas eustigma TaxID=1157962 RepID=A0A250WQA5_9CHLO|nr:hypothetical protein CEUSTIGMA_g186.t1 [Chlamydomonas eustigma]|eukprot:GAX72730.1 hypothetical protein CEUSTIGMA_g186.t1 [Chlamydomonas eustigma]